MSFLRTSVSVLATQAVITPIALLTGIVLARGLSVSDRGFYAVAVEFAGIIVIVMNLGWAPTAIYRLRSVGIAPGRVAGAALWVTLLTSAISVSVCLALQDELRARFLSGADSRVFYLALATIPFQLAGLTFTGVARGLGDFTLHNGYRLGSALLVLVGVGIAVLFERHASTALVGTLVGWGVSGVVLTALVLRRSGLDLRFPFDEIRQSLRFGFESTLQQVLITLHQRLDILLIAWIVSDPKAVAVYAVAVSVINRVRMIPMSIALAMFPAITGQSDAVADAFVARVSRSSVLSVVATAAILAVASPILVPLLFGEEYRPSVAPLLLLLPAAISLAPALVLARYFTARSQQTKTVAILLVATTVNVLLNLWWIPRFGILGAAAASVGSYGLQFALMLVAFVRESGMGVRDAVVVTRKDVEGFRRRVDEWWLRRRAAAARTGR